MEYLCQFRQMNEISTEEYKEYVERQLDQIREINVSDNFLFSKFRFFHFRVFLFLRLLKNVLFLFSVCVFQATFSLTKSGRKNYCNVFLNVKIAHVASEQDFYVIPVNK